MTFITIKEAKNAADLVVLKSKLESEGIRCRIDGELSNQVLNYVPLVFVKLQVWEEDMEKVKHLMIEAGEWEEEKAKLVCPKCGSIDIKIKLSPKNIWTISSVFMMSIFTLNSLPSMYLKTDLMCKSCYARFRK
jgi:Zn finger protein HypA/HybF involved in hydrogenase expression